MGDKTTVGPASSLPPGTVVGAGRWAVGNNGGERFAVTRRCRHMFADLAGGSIDKNGCLVCPRHGARYDVKSGRMVKGPQGIYAKVPGLGTAFKVATKFLPLGRGTVGESGGTIYVE